MTEAAAVDGGDRFRASGWSSSAAAGRGCAALISSFVFNFNNFTWSSLRPAGRPSGLQSEGRRDGYLASDVFRLAFAEGGAEDGLPPPCRSHLPHRGHRPIIGFGGPPLEEITDDRPQLVPRGRWRYIVAICAIIFALVPVVFVTSADFNRWDAQLDVAHPREFGTANFANLFNKTAFANWFVNSIFISGVSTLLADAGGIAAYAFPTIGSVDDVLAFDSC